jgi:protein-S-isoprenylcysteine O-methyltransferase Ste14
MTHSIAVLPAAIPALWVIWIVCWLAASANVKRTRWREGAATRALHGTPLGLCTLLLAGPRWLPPVLTARFASPGPVLPIVGTLLVAAGVGLALWARWHLGRNWSSWVTVKEGHALVRSGPYRVVRHPIYSGLLLAIGSTALAIGEWRGPLAVALALLGFVLKIRLEEARMRATFPEYEDYRHRTAALIPAVF